MPGPRQLLPAALCALACLAAGGAAPAGAEIPFAPCGHSNDWACGHVTAPLDPAGAAPGTVTLAVRRHRASVGEARSAIVALAGGPGQAAIPFAEQFAELLGPIAAGRDLIVFDQRGTGLSHPLSCHAFERLTSLSAPGRAVAECAAQIGSQRSYFTTAQTVADIEAIRRAGGYEKLVIYGTSYGTKVAEEYAQAHPGDVEALVLDSVVPPSGPDALARPTFAALPRVLRQICQGGACRGVTAEPVGDLAGLLARMHAGPLRARALTRHGRPRTVRITRQGVLGLLLAGDFSAPLRAALVSSAASARSGDLAPLARLFAAVPSEESGGEDFDAPLYYATTCEEQQFPWSRAASPRARIGQALAYARSLPSATFAPFGAADAVAFDDIPACAYWPNAGTPAAPAPASSMPAVPALVLSGALDLRTPSAGAAEVAAAIPGSHLLVVPGVGHSVLGGDPSGCAARALQAFFAAHPIGPCRRTPPEPRMRPERLPPRTLAQVAPARGYSGRAGRTAQAVRMTLGDLGEQLALELEAGFGEAQLLSLPELSVGGLRSGWASLGTGGLTFHDYSFVPGVTLDGALRVETGAVRVGGAQAARGTLRLGRRRMLDGRLGGQRVSLSASLESATAIVGSDATPSSALDPHRRAARAAGSGLAVILRRLFGA